MSNDIFNYLLNFSRSIIGLVFILSLSNKIQNLDSFQKTIVNFKIIAPRWGALWGYIQIILEFGIVTFLIIGNAWLKIGLSMAILLLAIFSFALLSVLRRNFKTACNCFSTSQKDISYFDVWRNIVFIVCAVIGLIVEDNNYWTRSTLSPIELLFIIIVAIIFIAVFLNLGQIAQIQKSNK